MITEILESKLVSMTINLLYIKLRFSLEYAI